MPFRHVVMFRWSDTATPDQRSAAIEAVRAFGEEITDLGRLVVGTDAGLAEGNADAVVSVELADADAYAAYATDPRHLRLVADHLRPILHERWAVQHEL